MFQKSEKVSSMSAGGAETTLNHYDLKKMYAASV